MSGRRTTIVARIAIAAAVACVVTGVGGCESAPNDGAQTTPPGVEDQPSRNQATENSIYDSSLSTDNDR